MILYFVENHRGKLTDDDRKSLKIDYAFDRTPRTREAAKGPGGKAGVVAAQTDEGARVLFDAANQTWCQHPLSESVWFGWWNNYFPNPADLQKAELTPGHTIRLSGHQWTIPVARRVSIANNEINGVSCCLPMKALTDGSKVTGGTILNRFRRLWEISQRVWPVYEGLLENDQGVDLPTDHMELTAELIAWNYRLSLAEICELELVRFNDPEHNWQVLRLVCDIPTLDQWFKKKDELTNQVTNTASFLPPG